MHPLIYLSLPYSDPDPAVRAGRVALARSTMAALMSEGNLVICPVAMNHEALDLLRGTPDALNGSYWRDLEVRLAAACNELVVVTAAGWKVSRGVTREIALFEAAGKPIGYLPADPQLSDADVLATDAPRVSKRTQSRRKPNE